MKVKLQGHTEVHKDSYEEGELNHVNSFSFDAKEYEIADSDEILNTIESYFDSLGYDCNATSDGFVEEDRFSYNVLVDSDNCEASSNEIELWKKGEMTLYNSSISVIIEEIKPFSFKGIL